MPVTMAEIPPKLIGGIDYSDFEARAEQINEKEFIIRHKVDLSKDIKIEMFIDEEGKVVEW